MKFGKYQDKYNPKVIFDAMAPAMEAEKIKMVATMAQLKPSPFNKH